MTLSIGSTATALRLGKTTSLKLTEAALAAADEMDATIGTYIARFDQQALAAASHADAELAAGLDRGPLHGIPLAVKDNIATVEGHCTVQSAFADASRRGREVDAVSVARLRTGGAVILGKTTLMEFGIGLPDKNHGFAIPRNPWDTDRWAGGSSSGTANGVSAGLFFGGLGTDTAGSIRIPAAFCGVTGLKPTFGRIPRSGTVPLGFSYDTVGPIARSARDCAIILAQIAGWHSDDLSSLRYAVPDYVECLGGDLSGVRLGISRLERSTHSSNEIDALSRRLDAAVAVFENLGAKVVEVEIPYYNELTTSTMIGELAEAFAYHRIRLQRQWRDYGSGTRMTLASGALISGADYVQAQRVRQVGRQAMRHLFEEIDAVITPTVSSPAPLLPLTSFDDFVATVNTPVWNATGNPTVSVPIGLDDDGLPLAMQVTADLLADRFALRIADAFQRATNWHMTIPPTHCSCLHEVAGNGMAAMPEGDGHR